MNTSKVDFYNKNDNRGRDKRAFTLAEVLITIGIIGVIASITIPILIQNAQTMQLKTAAKHAYAVASQAVQQMKNDNGGDLSTYINTQASFKPIFTTYLKVAQDCGKNSCVSDYNHYNDLSGLVAEPYQQGQFITTDGMFWSVKNWLSQSPYIQIMVDVNGYTKDPNVFGVDTFEFELINNNLLPGGATGTIYSVSSGFCKRTITQATQNNVQGLGCMEYVLQEKDY